VINARSIIATIPARGGSKGVPRKNLRMVQGRPLIAWTISEALKSQYIDHLIVSTDDEEIAETAKKFGADVPFRRMPEACTDHATLMDVIHHDLAALADTYSLVVALQPTSPLRLVEDIDGAIETCIRHNAPACTTLYSAEPPPQWMFTLDQAARMQPVLGGTMALRRQDATHSYALNGAVFVGDAAWTKGRPSFFSPETVGHIMPAERSLDIDTELDLVVAEALLAHRNRQPSPPTVHRTEK